MRAAFLAASAAPGRSFAKPLESANPSQNSPTFGCSSVRIRPVFDGRLRLLLGHQNLGHQLVIDGVVGVDADGFVGGLLGLGELALLLEQFGEGARDALVVLFVAL